MPPSSSFGRRGQTPAPATPRRVLASEAAQAAPAPLDPAHEWVIPSDDDALPRPPWVSFGIIALLAAIFMAEVAFGFEPGVTQSIRSLVALGGESRDLVLGQGQWWRVFTAVLLHLNVEHIFGNSIALLIAGALLEKRLGHAWFAVIFVVGGIAGSLASLAWYRSDVVGCGASGAIMALLIPALIETFFNATIYTPRRARAYVLVMVIGALVPTSAEVDYSAHFGGAIVGGVLGYVLLIAAPTLPEARLGRWIATGVALTGAALAMIGFGLVALHYPGYAARNAVLVPDAEIAKFDQTTAVSVDHSLTLVAKYPLDPRAHMLRAISLAQTDQLDQAEIETRTALSDQDVLQHDMPKSLPPYLHALLALILVNEGHPDEAHDEATSFCATRATPSQKAFRAELDKHDLCAASPP